MSATNFHLGKGDKPVRKRVPVAAVSAVVWTPATSARIFLTGFSVSAVGAAAGTIKLAFGQGDGIFEGTVTGSATINSPHGFMANSTLYDESIYFTSRVSATDGYIVNLYGFERGE